MKTKELGAVILAAGRGKRMNSADKNKVSIPLGSKPMITHIVHFMKSLDIKSIVVVIGWAKETVIEALKDEKVIFSEQQEQLGTGHALLTSLSDLPENISDVLVVYGDDVVLYIEKQKN